MKFTTVLANGICMSDWLERAFLHGTQCKFEMIYLQSMHVALWSTSFWIWTRISQRLVRLQFELNSTMAHIRMLFSGKVLWRDWGSTRSGMPGLQRHALTPVVSNFMCQLNQVCQRTLDLWHTLFCCHLGIQSGWHTTYMYF